MQRTHTLDHRLRYCDPTHPTFLEKIDRHEQSIETFDIEYAQAAQSWSSQKTPKILPSQDNTLQMEGFTFQKKEGQWHYQSPTLILDLDPNTDSKSAQRCLKEIQRLKPILQRPLIHREQIHIVIGGTPSPYVGSAQGNKIHLPLALHGGQVLADALAQSSQELPHKEKVELHHILLHELGHTLGKYLAYDKQDLLARIEREFPYCEDLVKDISPHYLGNQYENICLKFTLHQIKAQANTQTPEEEEELAKFKIKITSELFAEMVRSLYLEPLLNQKIRKVEKTKGFATNQLAQTLLEESKAGLQRLNPQRFPLKDEPLEMD